MDDDGSKLFKKVNIPGRLSIRTVTEGNEANLNKILKKK